MTARSPDRPGLLRGTTVPTVAGIVAAGVFLGVAAGVLLREASAWMSPAGVQAESANPAPDKSGAAVAVPPAAKSGVAAAATANASRKGRSSAHAGEVKRALQVEERTLYQYDTIGRRDPFLPLVGTFVGVDEGGDAPVDVGGIKVVGIVWGDDSFALVEDARGNSRIMRRGDKVMNGVVEEMRRDAMVVRLTMDGLSQSVAIPLTRKGDQSNAAR